MSAIAPRNPRKRVKFKGDWNVAGRGVEKLEKLLFGIFQRGIRHVVDERNSDALCPHALTVRRSGCKHAVLACPKRRAFAAIYDEWHTTPPDPATSAVMPFAESSAWARSSKLS